MIQKTANIGARDYGNLEGIVVLSMILYFIFVLWFSWVGYYGGDDYQYYVAALDWVNKFPAIGRTHWSLRYPIVVPLATMIRAFGNKEFALNAINVLYASLFLILNYIMLRRFLSWITAAIANVVLITAPVFIVGASSLFADMAELFYVSLSFYCYLCAPSATGGRRVALWMTCGLAAGLGFMVRETSIVLVGFFAWRFLVDKANRRGLLLAGLTAAAIMMLQIGYLYYETGNPIYRFLISANHDTINRAADISGVQSAGDFIDFNGVISTNVFLDPILLLFVNQKIGIIFSALIIAVILGRYKTKASLFSDQEKHILKNLWLLGGAWALFVIICWNILWLSPRYLTVSVWCATVIAAAHLNACLAHHSSRRGWVAVLVGIVVCADLGLDALEYKEPMFVPRMLAHEILREPADTVVYANQATARFAGLLLSFDKSDHVIKTGPPVSGSLVAVDLQDVLACKKSQPGVTSDRCTPDIDNFDQHANWKKVGEWHAPPNSIVTALEWLHVFAFLPRPIRDRLARSHDSLILMQVEPARAG